MNVAAWLKNLGLEQYEAAFRDNAIDGDLLPSLTAEDLKDLGVTIVGHRRKLLDAIAAIGAASKANSRGPLLASRSAGIFPSSISTQHALKKADLLDEYIDRLFLRHRLAAERHRSYETVTAR